jgi:hypothetical protein
MDRENFYVISVLTNPERYNQRTKLFREFMARMKNYGVNHVVVECVQGGRPYEVTDPTNPLHIRFTTNSIVWMKENLINSAMARLPANWKYVAWIDGDVDFVNPDWVEDTLHELQVAPFVQLFEHAIDLGPDHEFLHKWESFGSCFVKGKPFRGDKKKWSESKSDPAQESYYFGQYTKGEVGPYWHSGYAWAATREAMDGVGGLIDFAIAGAGDHHTACGIIGKIDMSVPKSVSSHYIKLLKEWEMRALRTAHKHMGFVKGTLIHYWHGKKRDRQYRGRWEILIKNQYDPTRDIHKDSQGLIVLHPSNDRLRDDLRHYFQSRNEDSIDL